MGYHMNFSSKLITMSTHELVIVYTTYSIILYMYNDEVYATSMRTHFKDINK